MTSAQDKSPDRPEGAPEAAGGDLVKRLRMGYCKDCQGRRLEAADEIERLQGRLAPLETSARIVSDKWRRAEAAEAKVEEWRAMSEGYRLDKEEAEAEVARLQDFMHRIEWTVDPINGDDYCQWCGAWKKNGHKDYCAWVQAMENSNG